MTTIGAHWSNYFLCNSEFLPSLRYVCWLSLTLVGFHLVHRVYVAWFIFKVMHKYVYVFVSILYIYAHACAFFRYLFHFTFFFFPFHSYVSFVWIFRTLFFLPSPQFTVQLEYVCIRANSFFFHSIYRFISLVIRF